MDGNKIHWLWFGVITILSGVAAWTLSNIVELREAVKTIGTNQVWVMQSVQALGTGIKENRDLIVSHMLGEQNGKANGADPGRHLP